MKTRTKSIREARQKQADARNVAHRALPLIERFRKVRARGGSERELARITEQLAAESIPQKKGKQR